MSDATDIRARGACLESFRIDASSRAWVYLGPATVAMTLGALGVCTAFVSHGVFSRTNAFAIAGAASMLAGLMLSVLVAWPLIAHDEYIAALEGGLLSKLEGEERFVPWGDIAFVKWDGEKGAILIMLRGDDVVPIEIVRAFGRMPADHVAPKLEDFRRKASFSLL